jgi:hypothetical protein
MERESRPRAAEPDAPLAEPFPAQPLSAEAPLAEAALRVLAADGRAFVLQPWQIAFCFALVEGREGIVPPGCGVGKGWLDARLREAIAGRRP